MLPKALSSFDLTDRVAIVTGGSSGLGEAIARSLADLGARVAVVARRAERLEPLAASIGGLAVTADLSDEAAPQRVVAETVEALGPPSVLINAAGNIFTHAPAESEPLDAIMQTIRLNLLAPFRLSQEVFPHMKSVGKGSIVFVSSISGHVGVPSIPQASYAATKLGLSGLTSELAVQWGRNSIRVNTVAPGFFRSEITDSLFDDPKGQEWLKRNTLLPICTEVGADDVVASVLWLATDASRFVTGQTVVVDGGWTAR